MEVEGTNGDHDAANDNNVDSSCMNSSDSYLMGVADVPSRTSKKLSLKMEMFFYV